MSNDPWMTRFRAVLGAALAAWDAWYQHGRQWWVWIISLYLLGAPLEELVRLFTSGRVQVNVRRDEKDHAEETEDDES
jgi:hypothetical protein